MVTYDHILYDKLQIQPKMHFVRSSNYKCMKSLCQLKRAYIPNKALYLSRLMGKPTICICENKDADQLHGNREADQRLLFSLHG